MIGIATGLGAEGGLGGGKLSALSVGAAVGVSQTAADIYTKTVVAADEAVKSIGEKNNEGKRKALEVAEEQYR